MALGPYGVVLPALGIPLSRRDVQSHEICGAGGAGRIPAPRIVGSGWAAAVCRLGYVSCRNFQRPYSLSCCFTQLLAHCRFLPVARCSPRHEGSPPCLPAGGRSGRPGHHHPRLLPSSHSPGRVSPHSEGSLLPWCRLRPCWPAARPAIAVVTLGLRCKRRCTPSCAGVTCSPPAAAAAARLISPPQSAACAGARTRLAWPPSPPWAAPMLPVPPAPLHPPSERRGGVAAWWRLQPWSKGSGCASAAPASSNLPACRPSQRRPRRCLGYIASCACRQATCGTDMQSPPRACCSQQHRFKIRAAPASGGPSAAPVQAPACGPTLDRCALCLLSSSSTL